VGIVDFNNSKLLEHAAVKVSLLILKGLQDDVADVAGEKIANLLELFNFARKIVNFVCHCSSVRARLENRGDGSFSGAHVLHVLMSASLFLLGGPELF
jgi:hypothetical protein